MKEEYFPQNEYHTPPDMPHKLGDRLAMGTRVYFMARFIGYLIQSRRIAVRGEYDRAAWVHTSYQFFNLIEQCGGRFHITGLEHFRVLKEPVVIISNHMSTLETMVFPFIIASVLDAVYVVKEELVNGKFFGPLMRARDPIAVGRSNPREDFKRVITEGCEKLAKGISVIIFPQHTRKVEFIPEEFNTIGVKLASKAGVRVVPIAIKTDWWGNSSVAKAFGPIDRSKPIHIAFGPPMSVQGTGKQENQQIIEFIQAHLARWAAEEK
ncbi:MAG: lysophospholipid acyltransferase family protein [Kiritimatiellia bacterium]